MKTIKVSEASGAVLNWMVLKALGHDFIGFNLKYMDAYPFSTDWAQGGPIIEREFIELTVVPCGHSKTYALTDVWIATLVGGDMDDEASGPTPLIAAMRCYVASKLGDTVEVPDEI